MSMTPDQRTERLQRLLRHEDEMIEQHGVFYTLVFGEGTSPGFVYTSGLSEKGLHDLVFVGSSSRESVGYLEGHVERMLEGADLGPGLIPPETDSNGYAVPVVIIGAQSKLGTHAFGTKARLERIGSERTAGLLQVVMPDLSGRFPWEEGYAWMDQSLDEAQIEEAKRIES